MRMHERFRFLQPFSVALSVKVVFRPHRLRLKHMPMFESVAYLFH